MSISIRSIEHKASKLADNYSNTKKMVDVHQIAKKLNIELKESTFKNNISGILYIEKGRGVIGYNKSENEVRQRFTIAHEIGHYFLHRLEHEIFYDKKDASKLYRNHNSSTGEDQMEREANAFAAALLMPKNRLKLEIEKMQFDLGSDKDQILEKLAATFKVSNQAMMYRILNLRLL